MTLDDVARTLYALDPARFTAARAERVKAARTDGDKQLAAAIGKLRRPTVSAWAVNLLAREAPEEIGSLLELGAALRDAQRRLSGDQLRELTTQRQQVVNALARTAGRLAAEHDRPLTEAALREIGQTLHAALADPEVAEHVREGTLAAAANYEGFGPAGPELTAVPDRPAPAPPQRDRTSTDRERAAAARQELDEALEALESAREAQDSAHTELDRATADLGAADERIRALRDDLERAEDQRRFASAAERSAQETLHKAERQLERVQRWVEKARSRAPEE
ncbi:exonuclease VII small subunit [Nocardia transvalensis]|uniref:Exonuclease VII small subunit n=1 Tax=Nocardia transvalensis TaxID=37333 RepID=A0A7W9PCB3_9NOCA|nr:hypothetical protein [Nocardia transvalensis]MBB5913093.1 exonuclease VII small subunit [Nocardia transvalensis]